MPARKLPCETRGEERSTTSNSPSDHDQGPRDQETTPSSDSSAQDKSGAGRSQHQSSPSTTADHPSSTAEPHPHPQAAPGAKEDTVSADRSPISPGQRIDSSPAPPQAVASPLSPPTGSNFAPQVGASGLEARSPFNKRAPASRSSHGIETLSGPPPALITQRSYQGDSAWRYTQPVDLTRLGSRDSTIRSINALVSGSSIGADDTRELDPGKVSSPLERSSLKPSTTAMSRTASAQNDHQVDENQDEDTLKGADFPQFPFSSARKTRYEYGGGQASQEDLFLNLAHADSPIEEGIARRRSRVSLSSTQPPLSYRPSSARRPNSSGNTMSQQRPASNREHVSGAWQSTHAFQPDSPRSFGSVTPREHSNANVSKHVENRRYYPPRTSLNPSRARRSSTREPSPDPSTAPEYRQYISDSPGLQADVFRQSKTLYSASDQYHSSPLNGYSSLQASGRRMSRAGGTESTVSTTAPSTVWDELETLKSRINNLEFTGKLPSSSAASNGNALGQRPTTAGTTMTTLSSSPKHGRLKDGSLEASPAKAPADNNTHSLLLSALGRSKEAVTSNVYRALETATSDALTLAAMTGSQETSDNTGSTADSATAIDRKLRRKADSMCRSLTELCIALADVHSESATSRARSRAGSRDTATISPSPLTATAEPHSFRATSLEPDPSRVSSRAMSRFEARRASIQALSQRGSSPVSPTTATPTQPHHQPPYQPPSQPPSLSRPTSLRRRTDDSDRPLSRALTEAATRPSPREYTSQHPLPPSTQRSPSVHSSLPQRKTYFSPLTPSGTRRHLETSTPPSTESLRLAQARRQQRLASQGADSGGAQHKGGLFGRRRRGVELGPGS